MKNLRKYRLSHLLAVLILTSGSIIAQTQQKVKKSYPLSANATINVDAQHTKLVFETWNKNEMEIEAFIDTKGLSKEEITEALAHWQLSVKGDRNNMSISSTGGGFRGIPMVPHIDSIPMITSEFIAPIMENLVGPMMQSFSQHPPLPPKFMENVGNLKFDHEAYKKDGEKYLKKWEKEMESKFGPEFEASMETWARNFEKDAEKWSAKMEVDMEAWGEKFGKDMEKWGEQFGKDMEAWGEKFGAEMEEWGKQFEEGEGAKGHKKKITVISNGDTRTKTLIVRMPKDAKLKLDVRFGEVNLAERAVDLNAQISHSKLSASTIAGQKTKVDVSYSPVKIKAWDYGVLNTSYVPNASIEKVKSLKLASASSDVKIGEITETAVISGTFGNLDILKLDPGFKSLNISLENSDLELNIPETALNFNYTGSQSSIKYPASIKAKPVKSYDSELINGYQKSSEKGGIVIIKARFSDVAIE